ncbi:MAG: dicarboxylate/amino acid:cation symporter [Oscillospiraceae bacterium]|nr:dicarboxylate/amino acid:cation symporter [Oscillospiraceae bacterium]
MENTEKYRLSAENIDAASEKIEKHLILFSVDKKNVLRFRLMFEEILLNYRDRFGEKTEFTLRCEKRFSRPRIVITVSGESFEPFTVPGNEGEYSSETLRGMLANAGLAPSYRYKNRENIITLTTDRKKRGSSVIWLLAAIVLAVAAGLLCLLLPENVREFLSVKVIAPVTGKFMGFLSAISGPLIFLSVLWGIYSIGDVVSFGKIGKRMIARFLLMSALLLLIAGCSTVPFFTLGLGGGDKTDFSDLYQMLLDIVPSNLITPFTEGNPLQIIFIAVIFGAAMLVLNDKTTAVSKIVEQLDFIVQFIMKCLNSFIPLIIFLSLFNMIIGKNSGIGSAALKPVLLALMSYVIIMAVYSAIVCVHRRVSPILFIKKLLPTFIIALTTASSTAAFATNVETCEKKLGIDKKIINFGLPLGQVVFMPGALAMFFCVGICMAETFQVQITLARLVTLFIIVLVLSIAAPPVPGGPLTCCMILITQLGIPDEAIPIAIAIVMILDFPSTAVNMFCLQTELTELAGGLDMLDTEILRNDSC